MHSFIHTDGTEVKYTKYTMTKHGYDSYECILTNPQGQQYRQISHAFNPNEIASGFPLYVYTNIATLIANPDRIGKVVIKELTCNIRDADILATLPELVFDSGALVITPSLSVAKFFSGKGLCIRFYYVDNDMEIKNIEYMKNMTDRIVVELLSIEDLDFIGAFSFNHLSMRFSNNSKYTPDIFYENSPIHEVKTIYIDADTTDMSLSMRYYQRLNEFMYKISLLTKIRKVVISVLGNDFSIFHEELNKVNQDNYSLVKVKLRDIRAFGLEDETLKHFKELTERNYNYHVNTRFARVKPIMSE